MTNKNTNTFYHRIKDPLASVDLFFIRKNGHVIKLFFYCTATVFFLSITSCKKFIEVSPPPTSINGGNIYLNEELAASVLTGIYTTISNGNRSFGSSSDPTGISLFQGLYSDELILYNTNDTRYNPFYTNTLTSLTGSGVFWTNLYSIIFTCNAAIEGLNNSVNLSDQVRARLLGEAKFLRAFCFFYLVNLYGDVPLVLSTDYKINSQLSRTAASAVYDQIVIDLREAVSLLSENYLKSDIVTPYTIGSEERIRPTKYAANAMLARTYLYRGDYINAEKEASIVINKSYYSLTQLIDVFKKNSQETIWSLQPVGTGVQANTGEGRLFILPSTGPNVAPNFVYLSNNVINSFDSVDQRKSNWVGNVISANKTYYFPSKYKIGSVVSDSKEYIMVLRLGELFLIRSEARARQNNLSGAISDLDSIRRRAGLPLIADINPRITQSELIQKILDERQVELFTEWGHRWFDLKRTGNLNAAMTAKGVSWSSNKSLLPIPQTEIDRGINIIQNQDY